MKKSTRTIYGAILDTVRRFNDELPILPNSTLNEKFDVFASEKPRQGEMPYTQYFGIGLNGARVTLDTDDTFTTKYREYQPRWASLLKPVPFLMRTEDNDLTPTERQNYRMRRIEVHNNTNYVCYYLRRLVLDLEPTTAEYRVKIDGNIVPTAWEPTLADLQPTPLTVNPNQVLKTGDDYLAAVKKLRIDFTANDIQELMDAVNIIYGDPEKANVTELALVSGVDRNVQASLNGISGNYTEAIYAQVTDFVKTTISAPNSLRGQTIFIDAGSNEPLLVVS